MRATRTDAAGSGAASAGAPQTVGNNGWLRASLATQVGRL